MASPLDGYVSLLDRQRLQQEFDQKKALLRQKMEAAQTGADLPSALRLANEYQKRIQMGDVEGANLIAQFAKTTDKGVQVGEGGAYEPMAGYAEALGEVGAIKKGMEKNAVNASDLLYNPQIKGAETIASERAKAGVGLETTQAKKAIDAVNTTELANEAERILPQATSGMIDQAGNWINAKRGVSTERGGADRQLKVIAAALTSNVPRFEGPQGVMDVELYKQAAADVANPDVPYGDRIAALKTVKDLQKKYLPSNANIAPTTRPTPEQAAEILRQRAAARAGQ